MFIEEFLSSGPTHCSKSTPSLNSPRNRPRRTSTEYGGALHKEPSTAGQPPSDFSTLRNGSSPIFRIWAVHNFLKSILTLITPTGIISLPQNFILFFFYLFLRDILSKLVLPDCATWPLKSFKISRNPLKSYQTLSSPLKYLKSWEIPQQIIKKCLIHYNLLNLLNFHKISWNYLKLL